MKKYKKYFIAIIVLLILVIGPGQILLKLSNGLEKFESVNWSDTIKSLCSKAYKQLIFDEKAVEGETETPVVPEEETPIEEPVNTAFYEKSAIAGDFEVSKLYINNTQEGIGALDAALEIEGEKAFALGDAYSLVLSNAKVFFETIETEMGLNIESEWSETEYALFLVHFENGEVYIDSIYSTFNYSYTTNGVIFNIEEGWKNVNIDGEITINSVSLSGRAEIYTLETWGGQENFDKILRCQVKEFSDNDAIVNGTDISKLFINNSTESVDAMKTALSASGTNEIYFQIGDNYQIRLANGTVFDHAEFTENEILLVLCNLQERTMQLIYCNFTYSFIGDNESENLEFIPGWHNIDSDWEFKVNGNSLSGIVNLEIEGFTIESWGGQENFNIIFRSEIAD